jgi:hypothetical protein
MCIFESKISIWLVPCIFFLNVPCRNTIHNLAFERQNRHLLIPFTHFLFSKQVIISSQIPCNIRNVNCYLAIKQRLLSTFFIKVISPLEDALVFSSSTNEVRTSLNKSDVSHMRRMTHILVVTSFVNWTRVLKEFNHAKVISCCKH